MEPSAADPASDPDTVTASAPDPDPDSAPDPDSDPDSDTPPTPPPIPTPTRLRLRRRPRSRERHPIPATPERSCMVTAGSFSEERWPPRTEGEKVLELFDRVRAMTWRLI